MAKYLTHKATTQGKAQTLQRRTVRTLKYANTAALTRSGRGAVSASRAIKAN